MDRGMRHSWPTFIRKRDGQLVPFDPDRVTQTLFLAMERLGQPDAFLARELTDGILHFLREQDLDQPLTTPQFMGWVQHVLRELGQANLALEVGRGSAAKRCGSAQGSPAGPNGTPLSGAWFPIAMADAGPPAWSTLRQQHPQAVRRFALEQVFSRHLRAAHQEELLELHDLTSPAELIRHATRLVPGCGALEWLQTLRGYVGQTVILDAVEEDLLLAGHTPQTAQAWLEELTWAAHATGLQIILHLNVGMPPHWAEPARGPLFQRATQRLLFDDERHHLRQIVLHAAAEHPQTWPYLQIAWHIAGSEANDDRVVPSEWMTLARWAIQGMPLRMIFERPRQPIPLADGVDRRSSTLLQHVGLRLDRLWERHQRPLSEAAFQGKVLSLVRLALSAGPCKREWLRRVPCADRPAFLIDRAHVQLSLAGVERWLDLQGVPRTERESVRCAWMQSLARRLGPVLAEEARQSSLPAWLYPQASCAALPMSRAAWKDLGREQACWGRGTIVLCLDGYDPPDLVELWHFLQRQTSLGQLVCLRAPSLTESAPSL